MKNVVIEKSVTLTKPKIIIICDDVSLRSIFTQYLSLSKLNYSVVGSFDLSNYRNHEILQSADIAIISFSHNATDMKTIKYIKRNYPLKVIATCLSSGNLALNEFEELKVDGVLSLGKNYSRTLVKTINLVLQGEKFYQVVR